MPHVSDCGNAMVAHVSELSERCGLASKMLGGAGGSHRLQSQASTSRIQPVTAPMTPPYGREH